MFLSYYLKKFAKEYEPLVFNNSTTTIKVDGKIIILGLWYCLHYQGTPQDRKSMPNYDL